MVFKHAQQVFIFIWVNTFEYLEHNQEEIFNRYLIKKKYSNNCLSTYL